VAKDELAEAVELNGILAVYDKERCQILNEIGEERNRKIKVHIKIDASLGRQGILKEDADDFAKYLKTLESLEVVGIYAHFANIEDTTDFSHAQKQINSFGEVLEIFKKNGFENIKKHISASSGILVYEKNEGKSDLVRLGISQFGMWPSEELKRGYEKESFKLKPILRWVTHIAQIKILPKDYSIGYGLTYVTKKPTKIAVIPQGYSDGYDRGFSNCGEVLIGGKRCPVLGRVAMNMFVVDVTQLENVQNEDEVVLLGRQSNEEITAEELAEKIGTINYEITTRISPLLPRIIID
jgi:alanine racemase